MPTIRIFLRLTVKSRKNGIFDDWNTLDEECIARAFSIEKVDEDFVKEAKGIVVGSPSYMAQMTPQIHNWLFEKAGELEFPGKMGGAFATEQYTHGGGTQVIQSILTIEMVKGMLCYSGGMACGKPVIHLGPVGVNNNPSPDW